MRPMPLDDQMMRLKQKVQEREERLMKKVRVVCARGVQAALSPRAAGKKSWCTSISWFIVKSLICVMQLLL